VPVPEEQAPQQIDRLLAAAGWAMQNIPTDRFSWQSATIVP
jgi:hypothetical protein